MNYGDLKQAIENDDYCEFHQTVVERHGQPSSCYMIDPDPPLWHCGACGRAVCDAAGSSGEDDNSHALCDDCWYLRETHPESLLGEAILQKYPRKEAIVPKTETLSNEAQEALRALFHHSMEDITFYDELTLSERQIMTKEIWDELCTWAFTTTEGLFRSNTGGEDD